MTEPQTLMPEPSKKLQSEALVYVPNPTGLGADWAQWNVELSLKYGGCWMVALPGKVICHGQDFDEVAQTASKILGKPTSEIVVVAVSDPINWR